MFKTVSHRLTVVLSMLTVCLLLVAVGCDAPGENPDKSALTADESPAADAAVVAKKCGPDCTKPCCAKTDPAVEDKAVTATEEVAATDDAAVIAEKCTKTDAAVVAKKCGPDCTKPCCAKTDTAVAKTCPKATGDCPKTDAAVAKKCAKTDAVAASDTPVIAEKCTKTDAAVVAKKCEPGCTKPCCAKTDAAVEDKAVAATEEVAATDDAAVVAKKCDPGCTKPCCAKTDTVVQ